jgi:PHD/YefM family antitoxin component YafN of YafNO toxin-antitoxin module
MRVMKTLNPKSEYIVKNGKATAVIMPIAEYEELLEDLHDLAVIARRKNEPTIPLAEVKRRLKHDAGIRRRTHPASP